MRDATATAVLDGGHLAGGSAVAESDVEPAFHGGWSLPDGRKGEPLLDAPDVDDPFDREPLTAWWLAGG